MPLQSAVSQSLDIGVQNITVITSPFSDLSKDRLMELSFGEKGRLCDTLATASPNHSILHVNLRGDIAAWGTWTWFANDEPPLFGVFAHPEFRRHGLATAIVLKAAEAPFPFYMAATEENLPFFRNLESNWRTDPPLVLEQGWITSLNATLVGGETVRWLPDMPWLDKLAVGDDLRLDLRRFKVTSIHHSGRRTGVAGLFNERPWPARWYARFNARH
jgi:GNAT superfamily N-acetyltransferase